MKHMQKTVIASPYTHTRISKAYLAKLEKLAKKNKRKNIQQLHHLIDEAAKK